MEQISDFMSAHRVPHALPELLIWQKPCADSPTFTLFAKDILRSVLLFAKLPITLGWLIIFGMSG